MSSKVRNKILRESRILEFIDFGSFMIFENASIQTMIFILKKEKVQQKYIAFSV
jgi:adenine-specific DNA-methyltransferase